MEVKHHVIVRFLQFKQLRMRAKQRNKRKHKKEHEPLLKKWHATYREKCIRTGADNPSSQQTFVGLEDVFNTSSA